MIQRVIPVLWACLLWIITALAAQADDPWSGTWESYWRTGQAELTLTQTQNTVIGRYEPNSGTIQGTVEGQLLRGTWSEEDETGSFVFALSPDGQTFSGRFGNGEYWNGFRDDSGQRVQSFHGASTPREALMTFLTAANDAVYHGDAGQFRFIGPILEYEGGSINSTDRSRRRVGMWTILDKSTFRVMDAPLGPTVEGGDTAEYDIGPAGATEKVTLTFRQTDTRSWVLLVPRQEELEAIRDRFLDNLGYETLSEWDAHRSQSPRTTLRNFILGVQAWDAGGREMALDTMDLSEFPPRLRGFEGTILADYLRQVIDRAGYVVWQEIPDDPDRTLPYDFYRHPVGNISIAPVQVETGTTTDGTPVTETRWLFTAESLDKLPELYDAMEWMPFADGLSAPPPLSSFFGTRANVLQVAPGLSDRWGPLEEWQWIGLASGVALSALAGLFVVPLARLRSTPGSVIYRLSRPLGMVLFALGLAWIVQHLGITQAGLHGIVETAGVLVIISVAMLLYVIIDLLGQRVLEAASNTKGFTDEIVASLATGLVKLLVVVGAIIACADLAGLPYEGVLTGLGIGGVAVAFAARDTVSNLLGGAILLADRPFKRGDLVEVSGQMATIDNVGLRSTRLRTFDDAQLVVPNSQLSDTTIANWGIRRKRKVLLTIALTYDTPADKLEAFSKKLIDVYKDQPRADVDAITVGVKELNAFSIDIELWGYFKVYSYEAQLRAQEALILDIIRLAEDMGVQFAFPTQTLHIENGGQDTATQAIRSAV
ncbi:MAG: mechanosensitive ion channel family protein [Pseudomonadota bacterium]